MNQEERTLVSEIKTAYKAETKAKLVIQKDMAKLRDKHNWSSRDIAEETGIPQRTVVNWLEAYDEAVSNLAQPSRLTPRSVQDASDRRVAKRVLETASKEEIADVVGKLPPVQQAQLAAAAVKSIERAKPAKTPAERREIAKAKAAVKEVKRELVAGIAELGGVVGYLDSATEELNELSADASVSPALLRKIEAAYERFGVALDFAKQLVEGRV